MKDTKEISLFINCATKRLEFGLFFENSFSYLTIPNPKRALEDTNLTIEKLLKEHDLQLKDVDCFYCLLGPGSNTGIRLGLTIPRTIYAFNPNIKLFGINTLKLFTYHSSHACLSDRNGNIFYGVRNDNEFTFKRVDKENISQEILENELTVERADINIKEELKEHKLLEIDTIELMFKYKDKFVDYSNNEEMYLPEYLLKI